MPTPQKLRRAADLGPTQELTPDSQHTPPIFLRLSGVTVEGVKAANRHLESILRG